MPVPLSQFVRTDEHIVKMPRAALVNSADTLPPKTRTFTTSPAFPVPSNAGEIGNYTSSGDDPTPVGDEYYNADVPTGYAVEYMVYVVDEGAGIEVDGQTVTGKVQSGDVRVAWARNSAWQTRFAFDQGLNRWALIEEELGVITNSPRLGIPSTYLNDWSQRDADFTIEVDGDALTVLPVADESHFAAINAGTVLFSRATGTFHFSAADVITYSGKTVVYREVVDGTSTVSVLGVASIERGIQMTFQANPLDAKKDLALEHTLDDELLSRSLAPTKQFPLSFVPVSGTVDLRYIEANGDSVPLVEGTDFVVDEDIPAIRFTGSYIDWILDDYGEHPDSTGVVPDSSAGVYTHLRLTNSDIVPNTISLVHNVLGGLTEDHHYTVDLGSGAVYLIGLATTETLVNTVFVPDTAFLQGNFTVYVNGVATEAYTLVPETGWLNLDNPLFEGDTVTTDYVSGTQGAVTGEAVKTSNGTVMTAAAGGEFSFAVQSPPVVISGFELAAGSSSFELEGDRTADYYSGALVWIEDDYYQVLSTAFANGTTTVTLSEPARRSYLNPTTYYTKHAPTWTDQYTTHENIPEGVSQFVLPGSAAGLPYYRAGNFVRMGGTHIYRVQAAQIDGTALRVTLGSRTTAPLAASGTLERTDAPIPTVGDAEFMTISLPLRNIPTRYDGDGDEIALDDRFPGVGSTGYKVQRNGVDLQEHVDYRFGGDGTVELLREPLTSADESLTVTFVPLVPSMLHDTIVASYTHYSECDSGVALRGSMTYRMPDTFYFRVVNNNAQAAIFRDLLKEQIKQKTGQVSVGSKPSVPPQSGNYSYGVETPISRVGDLYDNDHIAKRMYDFYNERIGFLEAEKVELCGEVVGGYTGPLSEDDVDSSALGGGRCFPVDDDITFAVEDKDSDTLIIPARPYRVPALFGMPVEDNLQRVVRDREYPVAPIYTLPPFPPQGTRYKGSNVDPILGIFKASAPTTFVENWYPGFLNYTYANPITGVAYTSYGGTTATFNEAALTVNQDTGGQTEADICFPPENKVLDPIAFAASQTFESAAPRDTVPKGYEAAALGALQAIDDAIEAGTLAGTSHRETVGDPTSYWTDLGFEYRDNNEYDLLYNGTTPSNTEYELLQAQWTLAAGVRAAGPSVAAYTDNIKKQILALNVQRASLLRQQDAVVTLQAQLMPTPVANPEGTTVAQAGSAELAITNALAAVTTALSNAQTFYNDVIVGGAWTDTALKARFTQITGRSTAATAWPAALPAGGLDGRIGEVVARISQIVSRLGQINSTLGFDNTQEPTGFASITTSENLYTTRYTLLDLRLNRESGTLFKARSAHQQCVRDINEAWTLYSLLTTFGE